MYNKLRWRLSVYHLSESWATKRLDGKVIHYVKRWLHFHQGANLTHLKLSVSKFGMGFQLPSGVLKYCKLSMRQVLFKSINKEIQDLFHLTSGNYIHTDSLIVNCEGRPRKELSNQIENNGTYYDSKGTRYDYADHEAGIIDENYKFVEQNHGLDAQEYICLHKKSFNI